MVTLRTFIVCLFSILFVAQSVYPDDTRVSVQLSDKEIFPKQKITGTITVQHNRSDEIDPTSFSIDGDPLHVEFIRNVEISPQSDLVISFYRFVLPPQQPGLQVLPGVKVNVGGKAYRAPATTYEVKRASTIARGPGGIVLQLEAYVDGKLPMYVGQQISVGYRIFFNGNIELTEQVLPLLDAVGFKKIGSERIGDVKEGAISVRQIEQDIEATKPGTYSFGPSYLSGYTYTVDWRGKKKAVGGNIKAEAAPFEIVVLDFPKDGRPPSFNGSVGQEVEFSVSLLSPPQATVGDKFILSVVFSSREDMSDIKLPEICCQPGFPGFFELDDIPPLPVERDGQMMYSVDLRPLSANIREIPSIEFSYFNPDKEQYVIKRSKNIPVKVNPSPDRKLPLAPETPSSKDVEKKAPPKMSQSNVTWPASKSETQPIEIHTNYPLEMSDLSNHFFGTWAVLLIIPFGLLALYIQVDLRERRKSIAVKKSRKDSKYWFKLAKSSSDDPAEFHHFLNKAFVMRLYEEGFINTDSISPQELPSKGICKEIKSFLCGIEEMRFTTKKQLSHEEIIRRADVLFHKIEKGTKG